MPEAFRLTVPGDPKFIQVVKMAISSMASLEGMDYEGVEDVAMAVAEACKIVTCHNQDCWSASYEVVCEKKEKSLHIEVIDRAGSQGISKGSVRTCLDCPREGDLSIQVIKSLMDQVDIIRRDEGYKSIAMVKEIC